MKLASLKNGRDGRLVVVSRDLARCVAVPEIAATLQQALDRWEALAPQLRGRFRYAQRAASTAMPFLPVPAAWPRRSRARITGPTDPPT